MFIAQSQPTVLFLVRDVNTGQYMGFDEPTVYWKQEHAKKGIERQKTRTMSNHEWEIVAVTIPVMKQHQD